METICPSAASVLTRATRYNVPEDKFQVVDKFEGNTAFVPSLTPGDGA
jgi:hypothetical protein